jgi:hypothetical protein
MHVRKLIVPLFVATLLAMPSTAFADGSFRTVLVIDASWSMRKTDPKKLRMVAAELFVDLARDGDQIAVTGFDGAARQSTGGFITIDGPDSRVKVKEAIRAIGDDGKATDFTAGLYEAKRLLDAATKGPDDQELILFLTDGRCEPDPKGPFADRGKNKTERTAACLEAVQNEIVPALGGARVYPIGLSKQAPADFLEEFGRRTGGKGAVTIDPKGLPSLFAGVYARLLGSRLQEGAVESEATFTVYDGAVSLDVVIVGRATKTGKLVDPNGREIPLHNRNPKEFYFVGAKEYRFYKIAKPKTGDWKLQLDGTKGRTFATLQHFNLQLALMGSPSVVEQGQSGDFKARLASPEGVVPPSEFLDRHIMYLVAMHGDDEERLEMKRGDQGVYTASMTMADMGSVALKLILEPGPDGVLSRETGELGSVTVIPPVEIRAAAIALEDVKQGKKVTGTVSFDGSKLGVAVEVSVSLDVEGVTVTPAKLSLTADGAPTVSRSFELTFDVSKSAKAGDQSWTLTFTPVSPDGFDDKKTTADAKVKVVALTFWEKHGTKVLIGAGAVVFLILLMGFISPASFKKRAIVYYVDNRDSDMERQSSYPLGSKAKRGFYRPARIRLSPSGPVKKGGVVLLEAQKGGRVLAMPSSSSAKVFRAPNEDEDDFVSDEDRPRISLKDGGFRMSPGSRYEIDGSGLVFWYK